MFAKRMFIGYFLLICIMMGIGYIYDYLAVLYFLGTLILYGSIAFVIHRAYTTIRKKHKKTYSEFLIIFVYKISILTSIILVLVGYFIYHQTHLFPAKLPSYTLSNGSKTVVFQTMSHVGSAQFYTGVQERLKKAKENNYVLFFEGVTPGTEENKQKFDEALGVSLNPESYETLAYLYGLTSQDNEMFLGLVNEKDYNVDISIDEIVEIYESKNPENIQETGSGSNLEKIYNIEEEVLSQLDNLSGKELFLIRYFNQAVINFIMKHDGLRDSILSLTGRDDIFKVILDDRNEFLAENIIESDFKKIYILYGLMHFQGVLEILQANDPSWKVITTQYSRVIYPPKSQESK